MKNVKILLVSLVCVCLNFAAVCSARGLEAGESMNQKICLNGLWQFRAAGTTADTIPEGKWRQMRVPSTWGRGGEKNFVIDPKDQKSAHAWYRREFFVPKSWDDGRRIKLKFMGVDWGHKIYVNKKPLHESDYLGICFNVDITDNVRFGQQNELTVLAVSRGHRECGIIRSVYLTCCPPVYAEYTHAITSVRDKKLTVKVRVCNEDAVAQTAKVKVSVLDNGKVVLTMPVKKVRLSAGKSREVTMSMPWKDPVLWGFGQYGKPYLYHLETTVTTGKTGDRRYDRFGFREFLAEGKKFTLNGKPIFLKGDLISSGRFSINNPYYVAAFYQAHRSCDNINYQRLHTLATNNFDSKYWFDVADELGHLVQTQFQPKSSGVEKVDDPRVLEVWTNYVNEHFNHPGLIMWCPDNERFTKPLPIENCIDIVREVDLKPWNNLTTHIRKLDPTRPIDYEHGWALYDAVKSGDFDRENYMVFNIHPYNRRGKEIDRARKAMDFDDSVPVMVGEIFDFGRNIDILGDPAVTYLEQRRRGNTFARGILAVAKHGASGTSLCSIQRAGYVGYDSNRKLHLGPWSDIVAIRDNGKVIGLWEGRINVPWPSLSGDGTKVEYVNAMIGSKTSSSRGGTNMNWFDPTRPICIPNVANEIVKRAYHDVDGRDEPPLGPQRAAEVVVCFGENSKPVEGAYVYLVPMQGQAKPAGVATDPDGTAWFRLWDEGKYRVVVENADKTRTHEREIIEVIRPKWEGKPGYAHIQWVDMGGINVANRVNRLKQPAKIAQGVKRLIRQGIYNGNMDYWPSDMVSPVGWGCQGKTHRESKIKGVAKYAVRLEGNIATLTQRITLKPGMKYKVSARICKVSGRSCGGIGIRTASYKWLCNLQGSKDIGKWKTVEAEYVANGKEVFFYCFNWYMGKNGACIYDDLSVEEIGPAAVVKKKIVPLPLQAGPFKTDKDGFIQDWLVCGPFPNRATDKSSEGFETDQLLKSGGERKIKPQYGMKHQVHFPPSDFWLEGTITHRWADQHGSYRGMVRPRGMGAESLGLKDEKSSPNHIAGYLACYIYSPKDQDVTLAIGSDDGHKIWLNHKLIGQDPTTHAAKVDEFKYPVHLKKGKNVLVIKMLQAIGGFQFCLRFMDNDKPITNLTVLLERDVPSEQPRRLTDCGAGQPVWSADGKYLFYLADKDQSLWSIDVKSAKREKIVKGPISEYDLSPDGGKIIFITGKSMTNRQIVVVDLKTRKQHSPAKESGYYSNVLWLGPTQAAYRVRDKQGFRRVCMDIKSSKPIASPKLPNGQWVVSQNGKQFAVVDETPSNGSRIRVYDGKGQLLATIARATPAGAGGGGCFNPSFSPDGRFVAYAVSPMQPSADIYIYNLKSGKVAGRITTDTLSNRKPNWSPDGKTLAYESAKGGSGEIWTAPVKAGSADK